MRQLGGEGEKLAGDERANHLRHACDHRLLVGRFWRIRLVYHFLAQRLRPCDQCPLERDDRGVEVAGLVAPLRLEDDTFVHLVETEADAASAIPGLAAFKLFQSGIRERCIEPPEAGSAIIVGNYGMLDQ